MKIFTTQHIRRILRKGVVFLFFVCLTASKVQAFTLIELEATCIPVMFLRDAELAIPGNTANITLAITENWTTHYVTTTLTEADFASFTSVALAIDPANIAATSIHFYTFPDLVFPGYTYLPGANSVSVIQFSITYSLTGTTDDFDNFRINCQKCPRCLNGIGMNANYNRVLMLIHSHFPGVPNYTGDYGSLPTFEKGTVTTLLNAAMGYSATQAEYDVSMDVANVGLAFVPGGACEPTNYSCTCLNEVASYLREFYLQPLFNDLEWSGGIVNPSLAGYLNDYQWEEDLGRCFCDGIKYNLEIQTTADGYEVVAFPINAGLPVFSIKIVYDGGSAHFAFAFSYDWTGIYDPYTGSFGTGITYTSGLGFGTIGAFMIQFQDPLNSASPFYCCTLFDNLVEGPDYKLIDGGNNAISTNQTWRGKYYVTAPIVVSAGATLDLSFVDLVFEEGMGITFQHDSHIRANNAVFRPCDEKGKWAGFTFEDDSYGMINECLFKNAEIAIHINTSGSVRIDNNNIINSNDAIVIEASATPFDNTITGNTFLLNNEFQPRYQPLDNLYSFIKIGERDVTGIIAQNDFVSQNEMLLSTPALTCGIYCIGGSFTASTNTFTDVGIGVYIIGNSDVCNVSNNHISISKYYYSRILAGGIGAQGCLNPVRIERNVLTCSGTEVPNIVGIYVGYSDGAAVVENTINNWGIGDGGSAAIDIDYSTNCAVLGNKVTDSWLGIDIVNSVSGIEVRNNTLHMNNQSIGIGINFYVDLSSRSAYDETTITIADNCIYDVERAINLYHFYGAFAPLPLMTIEENYMANFVNYGLYIDGFNGSIGDGICANTALTSYGRNAFVSNFVDFGGAFNVFSIDPTVTMRGNYLYSANPGVNANVTLVPCDDVTPGMGASCGIMTGSMYNFEYLVQELITRGLPITKGDKDYQLGKSYLSRINASEDKLDYVVRSMSLLSLNSDNTEMDKLYNAVKGSSTLDAHDMGWLTFKYHLIKKDWAEAKKSLQLVTAINDDEKELKGIEQIRLKYAGVKSIQNAVPAERDYLNSVDNRRGKYANYARGIMHLMEDHRWPILNRNDITTKPVEQRPQDTNSMAAYPNPTTGNLTVEYTMDSNNGVIQLTDIIGRIIKEVPVSVKAGNANLDLSNLESGIYIIKLYSDKHFDSAIKIIKK